MNIFGDYYMKIVAENEEQARHCYKEWMEEDPEEDFGLVDGDKHKMWFPVNELPEKYQDEEKYPQKDCCGEYIGVKITLNEAMKRNKEEPPYVLCVSSDLI